MLVERRNCWRKLKADRVAFLVDGAAYFSAFADAVERAQRSIMIAAWDIDSRVALRHDSPALMEEARLERFLSRVVGRRRKLHAYILAWDFAAVFALERELLPVFTLGWRSHRRIHFRLDGAHPMGSCHHQKIVVIDDKVAFVGGLDLTKRRWDTPEHLAHDSRRIDPGGKEYFPFHDVQMLVEGEAAAALGDLFRRRWRNSGGRDIPPARAAASFPWPSGVKTDLESVPVAIARTQAAYNDAPQVCEIKQLYLDAISSARKCIYIENQYFTSAAIGDALAERLKESQGPEIVLLLPKKSVGWLEESTMSILRARLLRNLAAADSYGRLRVMYPVVPDAGDIWVNLHAKILVVDDEILRIGSSNLNNRSMGLDTECDLALEAAGSDRVREAIAGFRNRLLAEHLGTSQERLAEFIAREESVIGTIENLNGHARSLRPLHTEESEWLDYLDAASLIFDPERPIELDELIEEFVPEEIRRSGNYRLSRLLLYLSVVAAIAAIWFGLPVDYVLLKAKLSAWAGYLRGHEAAPLLVLAGYTLGSLLVFPLILTILITAFVFSPGMTFVYALAGSLLAGLVVFGIGRLLGRQVVRRISGSRINRLSKRLTKRSLMNMLVVRLLPMAPFSIVNLVAGASGVKLRDFVVGTILGLMPGILTIVLFDWRIEALLKDPGFINGGALVVLFALFLGAYFGINRYLSRKLLSRQADSRGGRAVFRQSTGKTAGE